jgi:hypothetical protein
VLPLLHLLLVASVQPLLLVVVVVVVVVVDLVAGLPEQSRLLQGLVEPSVLPLLHLQLGEWAAVSVQLSLRLVLLPLRLLADLAVASVALRRLVLTLALVPSAAGSLLRSLPEALVEALRVQLPSACPSERRPARVRIPHASEPAGAVAFCSACAARCLWCVFVCDCRCAASAALFAARAALSSVGYQASPGMKWSKVATPYGQFPIQDDGYTAGPSEWPGSLAPTTIIAPPYPADSVGIRYFEVCWLPCR